MKTKNNMNIKIRLIAIAVLLAALFLASSCVSDAVYDGPPAISAIALNPLVPNTDVETEVIATVTDLQGVQQVWLHYKLGDNAAQKIAMQKVGDTKTYKAAIPTQVFGTTVNYYVEAINTNNKTALMPAKAPQTMLSFTIGGKTLLHYWSFNTVSATVEEVAADFSLMASKPKISYPGTGAGYLDGRTHREADPVSNLNLRLTAAANEGSVLRVRNPSNTRELIIESPSNGFKDLEVKFAITRTSTGAQQQEFYYSANNGTSWMKIGEAYNVPEITTWELKTFNLSQISAVNNNAQLKFKILFVGEGTSNASGNNRIDNFSVDAASL